MLNRGVPLARICQRGFPDSICMLMSLLPRAVPLRPATIVRWGSRCRVVGFPTYRPHGNGNHQHKIHDFTQFDGNHRLHVHKFLGLSYPDGLIAMYGPYGGTRHDGAMFLAARIVVTLMHFRATNLGWWAIFGDSASHSGRIVSG